MTNQTPAEMREQAKRLRMRAEIAERKHEHPTTVSDLRAGADALDRLADVIEFTEIYMGEDFESKFFRGRVDMARLVSRIARGESNR